jgi:hypothetical protein
VIVIRVDRSSTTGYKVKPTRVRAAAHGHRLGPDDVLDALHRLEVQRVMERRRRIKQQEAKPDVAIKKVASVGL